jgi:hypothetical protein
VVPVKMRWAADNTTAQDHIIDETVPACGLLASEVLL